VSERSDLQRALFDAWNEQGMAALETEQFKQFVRTQVHPELEARVFGNPMLPDTYRGRAGWERVIREWNEIWEEMSYEVEEVLESEDTLVMVVRLRGRGSESGVDVDSTWGWVLRYRDGQIARWEIHRDPDRARAALTDA
jgi:ketosteroid isomerase-like protein